jgi:hypothetical protein
MPYEIDLAGAFRVSPRLQVQLGQQSLSLLHWSLLEPQGAERSYRCSGPATHDPFKQVSGLVQESPSLQRCRWGVGDTARAIQTICTLQGSELAGQSVFTEQPGPGAPLARYIPLR